MIRVYKEEGHYTIKRVERLPKRGNANWLYHLKLIGQQDRIDKFYRWDPFISEYEEINVGGLTEVDGSETVVQAGNNVTITGTGTLVDPYIVSSSGGGSVDGVVTNVTLNGTDLEFTGVNGGFNGIISLSSLGGGESLQQTVDIGNTSTTNIFMSGTTPINFGVQGNAIYNLGEGDDLQIDSSGQIRNDAEGGNLYTLLGQNSFRIENVSLSKNVIFDFSNNRFSYNTGSGTGIIDYSNIIGAQTYLAPNASGTLARIEDLAVRALDEGNGVGYVRADRNPSFYGNVGSGAFDFSRSYAISTVNGATGQQSVTFGEDSIASGYGSFIGTGFISQATGTYTTVFGYDNRSNGYASTMYGVFNREASTTGYNFTAGNGNSLNTNSGFAAGVSLLKGAGVGTAILGTANIDITSENNGTDTDAPMIIVGNGTHTTPNGAPWTAITRSNLLVGLRNGEVTLPSTTTTVIDNEISGKQIITKEWFEAQTNNTWNNSSGSSGSDLGTQANTQTGDIIHEGDVFVDSIRPNSGINGGILNRGTGNLYVRGNQGLNLSYSNANEGFVRISSESQISAYDVDPVMWNISAGRDYSDNVSESDNLIFVGIEINDNVLLDPTEKPNTSYNALRINPTFQPNTDLDKAFAIVSERGHVDLKEGNLSVDGLIKTKGYTVSTLPIATIGDRAYVTDSNVAASGNFGATVAGGGANVVPVFYDGTNWIIA